MRVGGIVPFRQDGYGVYNTFGEHAMYISVYWYKSGVIGNFVNGEKFFKDIENEMLNIVKLLKSVPVVEDRVSIRKFWEYPMQLFRFYFDLFMNYFR